MTTVTEIRPLTDSDRQWAHDYMLEHWGTDVMIGRGEAFRPHEHDGFIAREGGRPAGLVTYRVDGEGGMEITVLTAAPPRQGTGSALLAAVVGVARERGVSRLWLLTTNDNVDALRFYQRRGLRLAAIRPGAIDDARSRLKPAIPLVGDYGIPLHDEIELELDPGGVPDQ